MLRTSTNAKSSLTARQRRSAKRGRCGFTLLEVLLATAIGVLLMSGLYVAMDAQLKHTQAGKQHVEQGTLARALLHRMNLEISASLGPQVPVSAASSSSASSSATGTGAAGTTGTTDPTTTQSSTTSSTTTVTVVNPRVQGDATHLSIFINRVPRDANNSNSDPNAPTSGDQGRIDYWLAGGDGSPMGLARRESFWSTSDEAATSPPDTPDDLSQIIAEEVRSVAFSYFDGTSWTDVWDGSTLGSDNMTPIGPPVLIAITISVAIPGSGNSGDDLKMYRHVVALTTANGMAQSSSSSSSP